VRERIEYRFRVSSAAVFTLYSYSRALEYSLEYPTAGSARVPFWSSLVMERRGSSSRYRRGGRIARRGCEEDAAAENEEDRHRIWGYLYM
jgi:hypothetical protein